MYVRQPAVPKKPTGFLLVLKSVSPYSILSDDAGSMLPGLAVISVYFLLRPNYCFPSGYFLIIFHLKYHKKVCIVIFLFFSSVKSQ